MPENEKDVTTLAYETLQKLLELMGVEASVIREMKLPYNEGIDEPPEVSDEEVVSAVTLQVEGEDSGLLIGRRGQTLASLQYILRSIVGHQTQLWLPITVDVEGYKQRRYDALQSLARRMADQVKLRKTPFTMEPMPAFERRIVHLALADDADVTTESTGEGEDRKVVILPRKRGSY